ncbi:hypothetical protein Hanom_Chr12g01149471 [Helianthus anomalus]
MDRDEEGERVTEDAAIAAAAAATDWNWIPICLFARLLSDTPVNPTNIYKKNENYLQIPASIVILEYRLSPFSDLKSLIRGVSSG